MRLGRSHLALLAGAALVVPLAVHSTGAHATGPGTRFTAPQAHGVVDLGDSVIYGLSGARCGSETVTIEAAFGNRVLTSARSSPAPDPLTPGACLGRVAVPSRSTLSASGWQPGDPVRVTLRSRSERVELNLSRMELDTAKIAAGAPTLVSSADPRRGKRDKAYSMSSGDVLSLGRVDLTKIDSVSLRACVTVLPVKATPVVISLHQGAPDGPALVSRDINSDIFGEPFNDASGYPDCWFLQPSDFITAKTERAPALYLSMDRTAVPVLVTYLDFNGTGAKEVEARPSDPAGTASIFDGTSFKGWDQSGCELRDGAVRTASYPSGCSMTYTGKKLSNVIVRLSFRMENFHDNGGIMMPVEIQMRQAGEWLVGGYYDLTEGQSVHPAPAPGCNFNFEVMWTHHACGYPADALKVNSFPDWNQMEIAQVGPRYVVRINGRTVTDATARDGAPAPYDLQVVTQPIFAFRYAVSGSFQQPYPPAVLGPENWGNQWYDNIRVYTCRGTSDPVCQGALRHEVIG